MPSLQSRLLVAFLRVTRRKRPYTDPGILRSRIEAERRTVSHVPPSSLEPTVEIVETRIAGAPTYTLSPRGGARSGKHVLYLHGGCYVFEITPHHWHFCAALAAALGCKVTVPIYPLAPEHEVGEALAMVTEAYRTLDAAPEEIVLMGDSAGGGMALALAQRLKADGHPRTGAIVLLSPWVDVTMENPEIPAFDAADPWLAPAGLVAAGLLYARGADPKDPRVSPIHGDLSGLSAVSIFIGTRDVLLPDARRLRDLARAAGTSVRCHEYDGMVHDFMLVDLLPEAKRVRAEIAELLRQ